MQKTLLLLFFLVLWTSLNAQINITGLVQDEAGHPLEGAVVSLVSDGTKEKQNAISDANGRFGLAVNKDKHFDNLLVTYLGYANYHVRLENVVHDLYLGEITMLPVERTMQEVEVVGQREIQKIDRKIIIPSKLQLKAATNGFGLLRNMQLSGIRLNTIDNTIRTSTGEPVQLRINGVKTTVAEIKSIRPHDVLRVEYHDMPGARYAGAAAVIDIIVRYKERGGNVSGDLTNGVSMLGFGEYQLSANYHEGKSELKAVAWWNRRDLKWIRENTETYHYNDRTLTNREIGDPTKAKFNNFDFSLWYSYAVNKSVFSVIFRDRYNHVPNSTTDRISTLYTENKTYRINDFMRTHDNSPSLDLYFHTMLPHQQTIYFDLVGTYIGSGSNRKYTLFETGHNDQDFVSETTGRKYSLIAEGIYEKMFNRSKLSFGVKHTQMYTKNSYSGTIENLVKLNTSETYLYTEWLSKLGKLTYTLGLGVMRIYNSQANNNLSSLIFRPRLSLAYNVTNSLAIKYTGYVSGYAPSLSNMSDVSQDIDIYQLRRGNPNLKAVTFVSNSLSVDWATKWLNVSLYGRYSYDHKPIMEETLLENQRFVRTMNNQRGFHRINTRIDFKLHPFGDWLSLQVTPFFNRFISNGNHYTHTHANWGMRGQLLAMYKQWLLAAEMETSQHSLWGETLDKEEASHNIALGYNKDKWAVQLVVANPFTTLYTTEVENLSRIAPANKLAYSRNLRRILMINVSFNLDFGKAKTAGNKRITNTDENTGVLHGR